MGTQNFALFVSSSRLKFHSLCSLWASFRGISVVFEVLGPSKMHVWSSLGHRVRAPAARYGASFYRRLGIGIVITRALRNLTAASELLALRSPLEAGTSFADVQVRMKVLAQNWTSHLQQGDLMVPTLTWPQRRLNSNSLHRMSCGSITDSNSCSVKTGFSGLRLPELVFNTNSTLLVHGHH